MNKSYCVSCFWYGSEFKKDILGRTYVERGCRLPDKIPSDLSNMRPKCASLRQTIR